MACVKLFSARWWLAARHLLVIFLLSSSVASAEFLYSGYLVPSFDGQPDTEYSAWEVFYAANQGINYPDFAAPNGSFQSASAAGFSPPAGSDPADPWAFWNVNNPTIQQNTNAAFIIGAGVTGNIYSFSAATDFTLSDSTPYALGTVVFQFQAEGALVDFEQIRLIYHDGIGEVSLSPDEYIREYRNSSSSFGGVGNRNALQWDLSGLGVSDYRIEWAAEGSSMSFQQVSLDTAATYSSEVPEGRSWQGTGVVNWSSNANWLEGTPAQVNGNVRFINAADVTITDSLQRVVGEIIFQTAADVTIDRSAALTSNTGMTSPASASGNFTLLGDYIFGAYNVFDLDGGNTTIDGVISGPYGMLKDGMGTLRLLGDNTFGGSNGGVLVQAGSLYIAGDNSYPGSTSINSGDLIVAKDAPNGASGGLGNATSNVTVGANSAVFSGITVPARLIATGDRTIGRGISFGGGSFDHRLGASGTTSGAVFSGPVMLQNNSSNVHLFAENEDDICEFKGAVTGGASNLDLFINEGASGTVVFSGTAKTYASTTVVRGGSLEVQDSSGLAGDVVLEPAGGATSSTLSGTGVTAGTVEVKSGGVVAPGASTGVLPVGSMNWSGGGTYQVEVGDADGPAGSGWDLLDVTGQLTINATSANPFTIKIVSLDGTGQRGQADNFSQALQYTWTIVNASGGITGFISEHLLIDVTEFDNELGQGTFTLAQNGNQLQLVFIPAATGFNTFLQQNFTDAELKNPEISGDQADFDNDRLRTLAEYAFGRNPKLVDAGGVVPVAGINSSDFGTTGDQYLTVEFTRLLDRTDINYVVKVGDSPGALDTTVLQIANGGTPQALNGGAFTAATPDGNQQVITAADNTRVHDADKRFMAVGIERP